MASTYNFTVRAEDDQGAFADRDFSIVVKNTSVDRYMIVDTTHAYTSPDMVNWTQRNNQGGNSVAYGGGKWMIHYGTATTWGRLANTYRLSTDGITYSTHQLTFVHPQTSTVPSGLVMQHFPVWDATSAKWWVSAYGRTTSDYNYFLCSDDGVSWTAVAYIGVTNNAASASYLGLPTFADGKVYYSTGSANSTYLEFPYDNDSTIPLTPKTHTIPATNIGAISKLSSPIKINDLWIRIVTAVGVTSIYSTDMVNWYAGNGTTVITGAGYDYSSIQYLNGLIVAAPYRTGSTSNRSMVAVSRNAKDWSGYMPVPSGPLPTISATINVVGTKGKIYMLGSGGFYETADLFETINPMDMDSFPTTTATGFATIR